MIGNSFTGNYTDNRIESEYYSTNDDDKESTVSYGSHRKRGYKEDSHRGSLETFDDEKKDASKEDFGEGTLVFLRINIGSVGLELSPTNDGRVTGL